MKTVRQFSPSKSAPIMIQVALIVGALLAMGGCGGDSNSTLDGFLNAVGNDNFDAVFLRNYRDQRELARIRSTNSQTAADLTKNYFEKAKARFEQSNSYDGLGNLRDLLRPQPTRTVLERRQKLYDFRPFNEGPNARRMVDAFYVKLTYPDRDKAPTIDGRLLKQAILEVCIDPATASYLSCSRLNNGDVFWEAAQ
jgi:hypothetical protein